MNPPEDRPLISKPVQTSGTGKRNANPDEAWHWDLLDNPEANVNSVQAAEVIGQKLGIAGTDLDYLFGEKPAKKDHA